MADFDEFDENIQDEEVELIKHWFKNGLDSYVKLGWAYRHATLATISFVITAIINYFMGNISLKIVYTIAEFANFLEKTASRFSPQILGSTLLFSGLFIGINISINFYKWKSHFSDLVLQIEKYANLSQIDDLTQLLNLRGMKEVLIKFRAKAKRSNGEIHLLFIDLNDLTGINDKFGHPGGNIALVEIASAIKETIRIEDVAARYGGDEFYIILLYLDKDTENIQKTNEIRLRLKEKMSEIFVKCPLKNNPSVEERIPVNATIGIHVIDCNKPLVDEMRQASAEMYKLKPPKKSKYT